MAALFALFAAGALGHALLPALPEPAALGLMAAAAAALAVPRTTRPLAALLAGLSWGACWGHWQLAHRLPLALDRSDALVEGRVVSLAQADERRTSFTLAVESLEAAGALPPLRRLRLTAYDPKLRPQPGERWRLAVRLRAIRAHHDPGAFDRAAWLLAEGVDATGYVRASRANGRLDGAPAAPLAALRGRLAREIAELPGAAERGRALLAALVLGDRSGLSPADRWLLVQSGTVHLAVVSGLHVGLAAGLGLGVGLGLGHLAAAAGVLAPARVVAVPFAIAAAAGYALLAGFGIPARRALIMTAVAALAVSFRRRADPWLLFAAALAGVAAANPLAGTQPGFWLSFAAVAALLARFARPSGVGWLRALVEAQLAVALALAPLLVYFQGSATPWAVPVNLVAVPWVSFLVVPLALLGALLELTGLPGDWAWRLAARQLEWGMGLLERLPDAALGAALPARNLWVAGFLAAALLPWLSSAGLAARRLAPPLLLAAFLVRPAPAAVVELTLLDVGQGLAAVVRVGRRVLVYDVGYGEPGGFNLGEAVVAPYLATLGQRRVDLLVVSHADLDHAGGAEGLARRLPVGAVLAGQPESLPATLRANPCRAGQRWRWEGVDFRILWPPGDGRPRDDNDRSCVLLVRAPGFAALLPGDIGPGVERALAHAAVLPAGLAVLVAAHHGSRFSTTAPWLAATRPRHLVFSTAWNNRFGHPHPEVLARAAAVGAVPWDTARVGAVRFRLGPDGRLAVATARQGARRYWHQWPPLRPSGRL
ncbi:MAG: DNA internalization-related competence protein ComEC/Rec2 [Porticoccaceae bacterium]|nr:MAG: DNA internalization-related competence protein ComEC/Rec2 [Porticoccaceae bacterium]